MIITPEQARAHLHVEPDYPAQQIDIYLAAAEDAAQQFLNRSVFTDQSALDAAVAADTAGDYPMVVNSGVKVAVLLILAHLHTNRENTSPAKLEAIPMGAHSFLWPYRKGLGV